jgi:hypothetical protein
MTHDPGTAGASARREHERRLAKDEEATRARWGVFGDVAVALSGERQSTRAWRVGAAGEEIVGARLNKLASPSVYVLHDRRIPRSRANIDHIVITTGAVWVIDAKRYKGRPELRVEGGILRRRVEKLIVGRRDKTVLLDGVLRQADHVRAALGTVPVRQALCFVEADWPVFGGSFTVNGVDVLWPSKLIKVIRGTDRGVLDVPEISARLSTVFRPA